MSIDHLNPTGSQSLAFCNKSTFESDLKQQPSWILSATTTTYDSNHIQILDKDENFDFNKKVDFTFVSVPIGLMNNTSLNYTDMHIYQVVFRLWMCLILFFVYCYKS